MSKGNICDSILHGYIPIEIYEIREWLAGYLTSLIVGVLYLADVLHKLHLLSRTTSISEIFDGF